MNLREIKYFVTLAETCHFGEAAEKCFVTQPALSMQIKKLEEILDVTLFERNNKQVILTAVGRKILPIAHQLLIKAEEIQQIAKNNTDPLASEIRLGVIPTIAPYLLPLILPIIKKHFPKLKIWLIEEKTDILTTQLEEGKIDAAIMAHPITVTNFHSEQLYDEPFFFVCSKQNYLSKKKEIKIDNIQSLPIMLLEEGHCLREQAISACHLKYTKTPIELTATSLETLRYMVQADNGVTLLPLLAIAGEKSYGLAVIPFAPPKPFRAIKLYWRGTYPKKELLLTLAHLITNTYQANCSL